MKKTRKATETEGEGGAEQTYYSSVPAVAESEDILSGYQSDDTDDDDDDNFRRMENNNNKFKKHPPASPVVRPPRSELIRRLDKLKDMIRREEEAREALEDMMMPLLIRAEENQLITRTEVEELIQQSKQEVLLSTRQQQQLDEEQEIILPDPEQALPPKVRIEEAPPAAAAIPMFDQEGLRKLVDLRLTVKQTEEEEWHTPFGESVFTLLYMCPMRSQSFVYSLFIYAIQIATIALTLADVLDDYIPHMVSPAVTMAQGVTVILLMASQSDLVEAIVKIQDGFYPEVQKVHPGADKRTWLISCVAQLLAGLLLLLTSLVLTLQAEKVLDLMLNLTALLFMAEIDDLGFAMAKMGFITDTIQKEAESVADFKVPKRQRSNTHRRVLYFLVLVVLYASFMIFKREQIEGDSLPTYIYVQFGDAYNAKLPYYSGILASSDRSTMDHRTYRDLGTENILLGYCNSEKVWAFSFGDDPCDFFAKSFETETYDVALIPDSNWQVVDKIKRLQPFDSFSLVSRDCDGQTCQGECGDEGLCECPFDHFGMDCEFSGVCTKLSVDPRFDPFPPVQKSSVSNELAGSFAISHEFEILQNPTTNEYVRVYNMPVYYSNTTYPANILFFGGRRWIMTSEWDLIDMKKAKEENPIRWFFPEKTVATLENGFHGYYQANYTPFFISDPVDFETPDFQPTPNGLKWWKPKQDNEAPRHYVPDIALDTFIACDDKFSESCVGKPAGFCGTGKCEDDGFCRCPPESEFYGDRCDLLKDCFDQVLPCGGNGKCDVFSGVCQCNLPYFGKLCEDHFKCYEEGGACKNEGVCDELTGSCDCPYDPAVSGLTCEKINDCFLFGCENGGVCGANGSCICPPPFRGKHCHLVDESQKELLCSVDADCKNGTCDLKTGSCDCKDPSAFGARCQYQYNCSAKVPFAGPPCHNNGICSNSTGVCDCPEPYYGHDCMKVRPCLDDSHCGYGELGTCDKSSGNCQCAVSPVQGKRCKEPFSCIGPIGEDVKCRNGGTCNIVGACLCVTGYSGTLCEQWVTDAYDGRFDFFQSIVVQNVSGCGFDDPWCGLGSSDILDKLISVVGLGP